MAYCIKASRMFTVKNIQTAKPGQVQSPGRARASVSTAIYNVNRRDFYSWLCAGGPRCKRLLYGRSAPVCAYTEALGATSPYVSATRRSELDGRRTERGAQKPRARRHVLLLAVCALGLMELFCAPSKEQLRGLAITCSAQSMGHTFSLLGTYPLSRPPLFPS